MTPKFSQVGTTALVAIVNENQIQVSNIGDSRCVLCSDKTAIRLSFDHRPMVQSEKEYIESQGGSVQDGRISGILAVSRALGDGIVFQIFKSRTFF